MKRFIYTILMLMLPLMVGAQKITLGSAKTKDGGDYNGEMVSGKPNGKGRTIYKNGNSYEGEYVKGKRQGYGVYTFALPTERNTKESGFRISSTDKALITS